MASLPKPDAASVRKQRSDFLASLDRPVSPPGSAKAPIPIDLDEGEMPPRKKPRHSSPSTSLATPSQRLIPSPFRLTKIQGLPESENKDTVSLRDILGNPLIREAWIFDYVFDVDWMMQYFDPDVRNLVTVKIIHGSWRNEDVNKQRIDDACQRWSNISSIQAWLPDQYGTHHTKLIVLLRHDDVAEVIIHTANMQAGDWTHATQAVWLSGPLKKGGLPVNSEPSADLRVIGCGARFKFDFLRYLKAYGGKLDRLVEEISLYDFTPVRGALIGSVPSKLQNAYDERLSTISWGHPSIYHTLREVRTQRMQKYGAQAIIEPENPHIVAQCSSVATLKPGWIQDTLLRAVRASQPKAKHTLSIVYPTAPDIASSLAGYGCGPSIHMKIQSAAHQKQVAALRPHLCRWTRATTGKHAFRDLAGPHVKTYISFEQEPTAAVPAPAISWALLTSANLSMQAWGTEPKMYPAKGQKKTSKFVASDAEVLIQSYELGVLIWPELWSDVGERGTSCSMVPTFGTNMPDNTTGQTGTVVGLRMPYDLPLTKYTANDVPWSPNVRHMEPDRHGNTFG